MKETSNSLRIYFFIVGILTIIAGVLSLLLLNTISFSLILNIFSLISLVYAVLFIYIGVNIKKLLVLSPSFITTFLKIVLVTEVIEYLLTNLGGPPVQLILVAILCWYLIRNVKRLSINLK